MKNSDDTHQSNTSCPPTHQQTGLTGTGCYGSFSTKIEGVNKEFE